uniref:Uncharacterized protein n=1 Tax=Entomoneis paludosa TaxID=265537 RepID=A0A7S2YIC4_9STRA|mmetsp:Transcript_34294/g.71395  ORF Transcript_34294/g.71395 Transcript_34294/m.71395 type:complete len:289 (+) Transcript_34294:360-1226(+)
MLSKDKMRLHRDNNGMQKTPSATSILTYEDEECAPVEIVEIPATTLSMAGSSSTAAQSRQTLFQQNYLSLNSARGVGEPREMDQKRSSSLSDWFVSSLTRKSGGNLRKVPPPCVEQAQTLLEEIEDLLQPLKEKLIGLLEQQLAATTLDRYKKTNMQGPKGPSLTKKTKAGVSRLEMERTVLMEAIDFLQAHKVDLQIKISEAMEEDSSLFELPSVLLVEIQVEMQRILSKHQQRSPQVGSTNKKSIMAPPAARRNDILAAVESARVARDSAMTDQKEWRTDKRNQRR